ncbi:hypothetical protein RVF83_23430 [Gordonia rubripertincta]|uniref:Uncharacterized protein n=2 Tax=Gordonia rubripertincta TaxID=36822 RepID=A0AAW6R5S6_GORRU|nr:hypothetical protein [Gordonia rubripertincta]MDG6779247.1 hypothetical protein [Gordonia rubripertincta]NKY62558.1 hypothetical protein [Gordonia rubripertincta]GAB85710.1 hypothetical protein GORBP_065_00390 [Gordonia rubripertincta NBRC 101908]
MSTEPTAPQSLPPVLHLTMGSNAGMSGVTDVSAEVTPVDLYSLDEVDLTTVRGVLINGNCDQIFLERRRDLLTEFVTAGGRVAIMGHPLTRFLPGLGKWRKLQYFGPKDLAIVSGDAHPVWEGADPVDVSFRRGVSGFYARGYSDKLPEGAVVANRIGRNALPVDYVYPLGAGQVLVHGGLDVGVHQEDPNTSARIFPQLLTWLAQQEAQV